MIVLGGDSGDAKTFWVGFFGAVLKRLHNGLSAGNIFAIVYATCCERRGRTVVRDGD